MATMCCSRGWVPLGVEEMTTFLLGGSLYQDLNSTSTQCLSINCTSMSIPITG